MLPSGNMIEVRVVSFHLSRLQRGLEVQFTKCPQGLVPVNTASLSDCGETCCGGALPALLFQTAKLAQHAFPAKFDFLATDCCFPIRA
jgi:hypothetical protein